MSLYDRIFKPHVYTLADGTAVEEKRSRAPLILLVLIALTVLSVRVTGFDLALLVKKGSKFFDILTWVLVVYEIGRASCRERV